jgi:hypothetical protein
MSIYIIIEMALQVENKIKTEYFDPQLRAILLPHPPKKRTG